MPSYSQRVLEIVHQARLESVSLIGTDHLPEEMDNVLKDAGSAVELFLKAAVYLGTKNKLDFFALIDDLSALGVSQNNRDALDQLRKAYNATKHDPNHYHSIDTVLEILDDTETSLNEIIAGGYGFVNRPIPQRFRRRIWVAAWDHYTTGETEVSFFLPVADPQTPIQHIPSIDYIVIHWEGWDRVVKPLEAVGILKLGRDTIPATIYESFDKAGDLVNVGVYEGDYRTLMKLLAESESETTKDLLPNLKRENDLVAMESALCLALVDTVQTGQYVDDESELAERIATAAAFSYAAPPHTLISTRLVPMLAHLLSSLSPDVRDTINGPYWLAGVTFDHLVPEAVAELRAPGVKPFALVMADGRLLVKLES